MHVTLNELITIIYITPSLSFVCFHCSHTADAIREFCSCPWALSSCPVLILCDLPWRHYFKSYFEVLLQVSSVSPGSHSTRLDRMREQQQLTCTIPYTQTVVGCGTTVRVINNIFKLW